MKKIVAVSSFIYGTFEVEVDANNIASVRRVGQGVMQAPAFVTPFDEQAPVLAKLALEAALQAALDSVTQDNTKPEVQEFKQ